MKLTWNRTAQWGECDPAGIIFYPNFYSWFDAGSQALMEHHGFGQREMMERHGIEGFPLIETHADFKYPVQWGDEATIVSRIDAWTRKTFKVSHTVGVGERLCVSGYEVRFWGKRDPSRGDELRIWDMPEEFVRYLSESDIAASN